MSTEDRLPELDNPDYEFEDFLCAETGATKFDSLISQEDIAAARVMVRQGYRLGRQKGSEASIEELETQECAKGLAFRRMYRTSMRDAVAADIIRLAIKCGQSAHEKVKHG